MANICENKFHIYCDNESVIEKIVEKLDTLFETTLDGEISFAGDNIIEGYFDSRWAFPDDVFEDFFEGFDDDSIYMRCLSEEYGCSLVSMNVYTDGQWKEPQCFDLY